MTTQTRTPTGKAIYEAYDGTRYVEGVPAWGNAQEELKALGIEVEQARVQRIYVREYYTGRAIDKGWIHCHFFGKDGRELAYYTAGLNIIHIFKEPRVWDPFIFGETEFP